MRGHSTNPAAIEAEIAHLRSLALDALRRHWRVIFGRTPPAALSKDLLGRMITYRLQEQAFGGLDRESLRFLDGLARHGGSPRRRLKPGTVLVRDYHGQRHTVTVVSDGFDWQGATYPSLSAIARAITGSCSAEDTQLGTGFCWDLQQAFCTGIGHHAASPRRHELAAICVDQKMIRRRQSQQHHCSVCAGLSAQRERVW